MRWLLDEMLPKSAVSELQKLGHDAVAVVDVELAGTLTRGQTVADWRGLWGRPANAEIVVDTDPEEFFRRTIERVGALARRVG